MTRVTRMLQLGMIRVNMMTSMTGMTRDSRMTGVTRVTMMTVVTRMTRGNMMTRITRMTLATVDDWGD